MSQMIRILQIGTLPNFLFAGRVIANSAESGINATVDTLRNRLRINSPRRTGALSLSWRSHHSRGGQSTFRPGGGAYVQDEGGIFRFAPGGGRRASAEASVSTDKHYAIPVDKLRPYIDRSVAETGNADMLGIFNEVDSALLA